MLKTLRQVTPLIFKVLCRGIFIIAAPSNTFALMFGASFGLAKSFWRMHLIMLDFLFASENYHALIKRYERLDFHD